MLFSRTRIEQMPRRGKMREKPDRVTARRVPDYIHSISEDYFQEVEKKRPTAGNNSPRKRKMTPEM
jgi:hypothetical protein